MTPTPRVDSMIGSPCRGPDHAHAKHSPEEIGRLERLLPLNVRPGDEMPADVVHSPVVEGAQWPLSGGAGFDVHGVEQLRGRAHDHVHLQRVVLSHVERGRDGRQPEVANGEDVRPGMAER